MSIRLTRQIARRFAETMLFWRGSLTARDVQEFLGVSERTARSLVGDWRAEGLLPLYKPDAQRRLVPREDFTPDRHVTNPSIALALLLTADSLPGNPFSSVAPTEHGHDLSLTAAIPLGPVREIIGAYLAREAVSLVYAAKTGVQELVFSPSAVVRSRGRYHLRGYRADGRDALGRRLDERYVDVVPARAFEAERTTNAPFVGLEGDDDWHVFEKRRIVLSPELSAEERLCYEHEYGIAETGELRVRQRRALMPYVIQELAERRCWRRDGSSVQIWNVADLLRRASGDE